MAKPKTKRSGKTRYTVRADDTDKHHIHKLAALLSGEKGVAVNIGEAFLLAVREALGARAGDGRTVRVDGNDLARLDRLHAFFANTYVGLAPSYSLGLALRDACIHNGLEQPRASTVEPIT